MKAKEKKSQEVTNEMLQAAYQKCCNTVSEKLPCHKPEYLEARKEYHELLSLINKD